MLTSEFYQATQQAQWLAPMVPHQTITLTGSQAASLLQGQLTNDLQTLQHPHQWQYQAYCNRMGRVTTMMLARRCDEHSYQLVVPEVQAADLLATLQHYGRFSRLSFTLSAAKPTYRLAGSDYRKQTLGLGYWSQHHDGEVWANDEHWALVLGEANLPGTLHLPEAYATIAALHRCEAQMSETMVGTCMPHELGLVQRGIVDWHKGCFLGQEIIARVHYRSQKRFYLYALLAHQPLALSDAKIVQQFEHWYLISTTQQLTDSSDWTIVGQLGL